MNVHGISKTMETYKVTPVKVSNKLANETKQQQQTATYYETLYSSKVTTSHKVYRPDQATLTKQHEDSKRRIHQLQDLMKRTLEKQEKSWNNTKDDYWGVEQTSDRMLSFSMALACKNPQKADEMIDAITNAYLEVTENQNITISDISKQTFYATLEKLHHWKISSTYETDGIITSATSVTYTAQV